MMRLLAICAIAVGCSGAEESASQSESAASQRDSRSAFQDGIALSTSELELERGLSSDRFNFAHVRELWVRINVNGLGRTAVVRLTLTTPTGSTFYESNVAYSTDPRLTSMNAPNAPNPISMFPAKRVGNGYSLIYVVPVVGTALSRYPIPGTWRVQAEIRGVRVLSTQIQVTYGS
jgi:hypothetical protein